VKKVIRRRPGFDSTFDVSMHIDETGRYDQAAGINYPRRAVRRNVAKTRDSSVLDRQIGLEPQIAGAVYDAAASNDQVELGRGWLSVILVEGRRDQEKNDETDRGPDIENVSQLISS
jgi:hypothetical protein